MAHSEFESSPLQTLTEYFSNVSYRLEQNVHLSKHMNKEY